MGGAVSSGRDNNELIDNLMGGNFIRTAGVERVFRALDRADYMTRNFRDQAYKDMAWRSGPLHMSAPCIYSEVMEGLELKPGLSFLNIGSGTGYLSTLAGLILGCSGISHGVELVPAVVEYANKRLGQFMANSAVLDEFDFCEPRFYCGNGLRLAPLPVGYDRVYCGAGCPEQFQNYFKQLIKVGGILVMPLNDNLLQVRRVSATEWSQRSVLNVSFATLRVPKADDCSELLRLEETSPVRLTALCRGVIRSRMRAAMRRRHPELRDPPPHAPPAKRQCPRRICIPVDGDSDDGLNALHDLDRAGGAAEMNALLSLVLSMGTARGAGALRLDQLTGSGSDDDDDDDGGGERRDSSSNDSNRSRSRASSEHDDAELRRRGVIVFSFQDNENDRADHENDRADNVNDHAVNVNNRADSNGAPRPPTPHPMQELDGDQSDTSINTAAEGTSKTKQEHDKTDTKQSPSDSEPDFIIRSKLRSQSKTDPINSNIQSKAEKETDQPGCSNGNNPLAKAVDSNLDFKQNKDRSKSQPQTDHTSRNTKTKHSKETDQPGCSNGENPLVPSEVEIYLGKRAAAMEEMDWNDQQLEQDQQSDQDQDYESDHDHEDTEADKVDHSSEDEETPLTAEKRRVGDSGLGEEQSASGTPSSAASSTASSSTVSTSSEQSPADSLTGHASKIHDLSGTAGRRRRAKRRRGPASSRSTSCGSPRGGARAGERGTTATARRQRLSVLMKRGVKELPLPYELKRMRLKSSETLPSGASAATSAKGKRQTKGNDA